MNIHRGFIHASPKQNNQKVIKKWIYKQIVI